EERAASPHGQAAAEVGLRTAGALWHFWRTTGSVAEGRLHLEALLALPGAAVRTSARAKALNAAGCLAHRESEFRPARELLAESRAIYGELRELPPAAHVLWRLGHVVRDQGD